VSDPTSDPARPEPEAPVQSAFTKEPQPELPLELRKQKAGWNRNRIMIWVVVGAFGLYMIITGLVGILTKAR
jgi:hypothetical protein